MVHLLAILLLAAPAAVAAPPADAPAPPAGVTTPPANVLAPPAVVQALGRAAPFPGARVEVADYRPEVPTSCAVARAELPAPLAGSGRVALRLSGSLPGGKPCDGWAWAQVRVTAPVLVASRPVPAGAPLAGAVSAEEREVRGGRAPLGSLPPGATAGRALSTGQALDERDLRSGPTTGDTVTVVIRLASIEVEQPGRAIPCARGRACAQMPSGKRVEGAWRGGRIVVESP
jgi:hypothetical protein